MIRCPICGSDYIMMSGKTGDPITECHCDNGHYFEIATMYRMRSTRDGCSTETINYDSTWRLVDCVSTERR